MYFHAPVLLKRGVVVRGYEDMNFVNAITSLTSFLANLAELGAGSIAIYLYIFKRDDIKAMYRVIMNYSFHLTLSELKGKLDKLSELKANEQRQEVIYVFHDIVGQLRGNNGLCDKCNGIINKIEQTIADPKKINEGTKRSLVSELREQLRDADISNYNQQGGSH